MDGGIPATSSKLLCFTGILEGDAPPRSIDPPSECPRTLVDFRPRRLLYSLRRPDASSLPSLAGTSLRPEQLPESPGSHAFNVCTHAAVPPYQPLPTHPISAAATTTTTAIATAAPPPASPAPAPTPAPTQHHDYYDSPPYTAHGNNVQVRIPRAGR